MSPQIQQFRVLIAEAIASAFVILEGDVPAEEIKERALIKLQINPRAKMAATMAVNAIQEIISACVDARVAELLQPGMTTFDQNGHRVTVERTPDALRVTNILTGGGLDISDGAFVVFIDSRSASGTALKTWQARTNDDTRLVVLPIEPPEGQTVRDCVAAKRQEESDFAV